MAIDSLLDRQLVRATVCDALFGTDTARHVRLGRFQLVRMLGRGAMGTVFEARDLNAKTRLAVKVLHDMGGPAIHRIKREFRALAGVVHPNLVALHELCEEDGRWFFTMDLVDGVAFDRWMRASRSAAALDEPLLRSTLAGLCAGVWAIHQAGKLHRDLKPANVLVTEGGGLKVLDYGLARDKDAEGWLDESRITGTPAYIAPEVLAGEPATEASDWYAVGVMLYESLCGVRPFDGLPSEVLQKKQSMEAPRADQHLRGLPDDLVDLSARLLQRDAKKRPTATEILAALGGESAIAAAGVDVSTHPFVGRLNELEVLGTALRRARSGRTQVVLLGGPSGIGKTALLEHFTSEQQGALVLAGRCYPQESVPYKVFDVVIDALARHLRQLSVVAAERAMPRHADALEQLFPVLRTVARDRRSPERLEDSLEQRKRAFGALRDLLLRLSDRSSIIMAVDDLQWGDDDSALMLRHLFEGPEAPPMLLVCTYRSDEEQDNQLLRQLLDAKSYGMHADVQKLEVGPLDSKAGLELAQDLLRGESRSFFLRAPAPEHIVSESAGIPLFLVELVRHARSTSSKALGDAETVGGGTPLHQLLFDRVRAQSLRAQRLLQLACVAGEPIEDAVVERALQFEEENARALLSLVAARLLRVRRNHRETKVEPYHDRVRTAVLAALSEQQRAELHECLASALIKHGVEDSERLIPHHLGAGNRVRAGEAALAAGNLAVSKLAFNRAVDLYERALELLPAQRVSDSGLEARLAEALASAGRGARAAAAYIEAADRAPPDRAPQLRLRAAQQYLRSGRTREGWHLARSVLAATGVQVPTNPSATTAVLLWERAKLRARGPSVTSSVHDARSLPRLDALRALAPELATHHLATSALLQARYLNEALRADHPEHTLQALAWEVYNASVMGGASNERWSAEVLDTVCLLGSRMDTPYAQALTLFAQSAHQLFTGRKFADATRPALAAKDLFAQHYPGAYWERSVMDFFQLVCLEFTGSLHEHIHRSTEALRDARERDDQFLARLMVLAVPYSLLIQDKPQEALDFLRQAEPSIETSYATERILWLFRMVDALIYTGQESAALVLFTREWPHLKRSHIFRSQYIKDDANYFLARCALAAHYACGDTRALSLAREALRRIGDATNAFGACGQAMNTAFVSDRKAATATLERAALRLHNAQAPLLASYARRRASDFLGDLANAQKVDDDLERQGVVNPERWLWTHMPVRAAWSD